MAPLDQQIAEPGTLGIGEPVEQPLDELHDGGTAGEQHERQGHPQLTVVQRLRTATPRLIGAVLRQQPQRADHVPGDQELTEGGVQELVAVLGLPVAHRAGLVHEVEAADGELRGGQRLGHIGTTGR